MSQHEVLCPACKGGNSPQALHCQWCGISLSQPQTQPPLYSAGQVQQPAQKKSQSGCVAALSTFVIGSVVLLISVYIQSLFATNNTTPRSATPLPFPTVIGAQAEATGKPVPTRTRRPATPVAEGTRSSAGNLSSLGVDAYWRGDYDQAIILFTEAINLEPKNARYHYNRATVYDAKGANDQAIEDYTQAIKLDSNYTDAYYGRATINLNRGKYDEALADFDQTISLHPNYVAAYHNRGIAYYHKGDHATAIRDYTKAIELAKPSELDLERVYDSRALAHQATNEHKRAIEDYRRALEIAPDFWHSYIGRAESYAATGEKDRAIADYQKVLGSSASDGFKREARAQLDALMKK